MDAGSAGTLVGGIGTLIGAVTVVPALVSRQLRACRKAEAELRDKVSALETQLTVLTKLVPEGEWSRLLNEHFGMKPNP